MTRPDIGYPQRAAPHCMWNSSAISLPTLPHRRGALPLDRSFAVPGSLLHNLGRGWRDWQGCTRLWDLGRSTELTTQLAWLLDGPTKREQGQIVGVDAAQMGSPRIARPSSDPKKPGFWLDVWG